MALLETIAQSALLLALIGIGVLIAGVLLGGLLLVIWHFKRYKQFKCVILEKDTFGQIQESYDDAGIFVDRKTKNKRLFLRKNNVGLNPDQIPYIRGTKKKTIYLYKTGLKNFHYIKVGLKDPQVTLTIGEENVNWAINAYERQKKLFSTSLLMQLLPFITIAFVTIMILVIFIYFFRQFGTLAETAEALKEAARALAQAKSGTVVIPS